MSNIQITKCKYKKYAHVPEKSAESIPWEKLCVDTVGSYTITQKGKENLTMHCVAMIDPATSWFEIRKIDNATADEVANAVELTWLTRYPQPQEITFDKGTEFMAEFTTMVVEDYGITKRAITTQNPQANAIIERIHQTISNIINTFELQNSEEDNSWEGILAATMFAVCATVHTTLKAMPMQLVFG